MEAYRILNKKSSRDAYDAEILRGNHGRTHTTNNHDAFRDGDYEMMRRYRAGEYYRYRDYYYYVLCSSVL